MRRPLAIALIAALAAWPAQAGAQQKELPRGGTKLFPDFRVVAFAGTPGVPALGALGAEPLE
ncbi:hypothetical protein, partial [Lactococcus petauri]|uniref:hypothetical protein n=1 Tax=Lactococcus petauri TaxID=1940789 RepID=UPI0021F1C5FA